MYPPLCDRPVPTGYTLSYNPDIWNVGHVFRWSNVYCAYLKDTGLLLTVKPNESLDEAYERVHGYSIPYNTEIFFVNEE